MKKKRLYEILVRNSVGKTLTLYNGPWNEAAEIKWEEAKRYPVRRRRYHVRDTEILAMFYGHPDMVLAEKHLDFIGDFYPEGA